MKAGVCLEVHSGNLRFNFAESGFRAHADGKQVTVCFVRSSRTAHGTGHGTGIGVNGTRMGRIWERKRAYGVVYSQWA